MNRDLLKAEFKKGYQALPLAYDQIAMTWGVSHYRYARGSKQVYSCREAFFKEVILSPEGLFSSLNGLISWIEKTDFDKYIDGLSLKNVPDAPIGDWLTSSLSEAINHIKDWQDTFPIKISEKDFPTSHQKLLEIEESESPRFYINTYIGYLSDHDNGYFFFESQMES